ncbi:MAG: site-specific integrase [Burkholderiaceae bacterium]|jgi:integrase|nr:site-specific integrase [Burkholderiaceae bacterium]
MGKPVKRANGVWGVQFKVGDVRESATFATRREADEWQARRKLELKAIANQRGGEVKTLGDALNKFREEVSPMHKSGRWEAICISHMLRHPDLPCAQPLARLLPDHLIRWRDARLKSVSAGAVLREMSVLGSVLSHAVKEWRWIARSQLADVRRPPEPKHRERVISRAEIKAMLRQLGYHPGKPPLTLTAQVGYAFMLALRTGMRASEITGLTWDRVHPKWVTLPVTKNGDARDVPLSRKSARLIEKLRSVDERVVFLVNSGTRDALFRKARQQAGQGGFTFHDARHTAATRIGATVGQPGKLSFPEFCRVFGWRDPRHALVYVNPSAQALADKL